MYQEQSAAAQSAFANLDVAIRQQDARRGPSAVSGAFLKKMLGGKTYWYHQHKNVMGKVVQVYLGLESPAIRALIEKEKEDLPAKLHVRRLGRSASELGVVCVPNQEFKVVKSLSDFGFFHAGGVLIGTHAFLAYQNMLGVNWHIGTKTEAVDFAHAGKSFFMVFPDVAKVDTRAAIESLNQGFLPNKSGTYTKKTEPDFQLDFLTSLTRKGSEPVFSEGLNVLLQPVKFMEFSMEETVQTTLMSASGSVVITVPNPARFALHKLIVFGERAINMRLKSEKDLIQAACLIDFFNKERPEELADAWDALQRKGKGWTSRCLKGVEALSKKTTVNLDVFGHR